MDEAHVDMINVMAMGYPASPTFSVVNGPTGGVLSGTAPNLTYMPSSGFVGTDSFTFKANDGSLDSNIATVGISVSSTPVLIWSEDFQTGLTRWTESNEFDWNVEVPAEVNIPGYTSSNRVAHADACTSSVGCRLAITNSIDLSGYQSVTLKFWRYVDNSLDDLVLYIYRSK